MNLPVSTILLQYYCNTTRGPSSIYNYTEMSKTSVPPLRIMIWNIYPWAGLSLKTSGGGYMFVFAIVTKTHLHCLFRRGDWSIKNKVRIAYKWSKLYLLLPIWCIPTTEDCIVHVVCIFWQSGLEEKKTPGCYPLQLVCCWPAAPPDCIPHIPLEVQSSLEKHDHPLSVSLQICFTLSTWYHRVKYILLCRHIDVIFSVSSLNCKQV